MPSLRGERSESGRLPELRRHGIHCKACGSEWTVRGRCLHPRKMPGLWRHWPEASEFSHRRWLTARPAVLTNVRGRAAQLPVLTVDGPARTVTSPQMRRSFSLFSRFKRSLLPWPDRRGGAAVMKSPLDFGHYLWRGTTLCRRLPKPDRVMTGQRKNWRCQY